MSAMKAKLFGVMCLGLGIVIGSVAHTTIAQEHAPPLELRLNHVGVNVRDLPAAVKYYLDKFGFREVARRSGDDGKLLAVYLQVSRDTFIELTQATEKRPPGFDHFGLETPDIKATSATLRKHEVTVSEAMGPMSFSGGLIAGISDDNVGRIELTEQPPDGKLRRAAENWK